MPLLASHPSSLVPIILILLTAAFARLYALGAAPPGLQHDEIFKAQEAIAFVERGDFRLFYPTNQGHEGLYVWLLGVSYVLFGQSVVMIKFPAFVCGMLTVALTYRVMGEIFNRRVGTLAAALVAVSFWAVSVSRIGLRANTLPVLALLVVWGITKVIEPQRTQRNQEPAKGWGGVFWSRITRHPFVQKGKTCLVPTSITGILLGLTLYTYTSSFAVFVAFGGFVVALMRFDRETLRLRWRDLLLIAVIAGIVALPMVVIRITDPQGQNRVSTITRPLTDFMAGKPNELIGNFWGLIGMPYFTGDPEWRYNVANRAVFATPVGLLAYVGFARLVWRVRRQPLVMPLVVFATVGLVPSLLTVSAPSFLRSVLALPVMMVCVALAVDGFTTLIRADGKNAVPPINNPENNPEDAPLRLRGGVGLGWILGILIIALTAVTDWHAYFNLWTTHAEVKRIYRDDLEQLAAYLEQAQPTLALVSTTDTGLDPLLFAYYQPPRDSRVAFFDGRTTIALSAQPALLFISPDSAITPPHADWLTSANGTQALAPLLDQDGALAYHVYTLNTTDALQTRLTQAQTQPVYLYTTTATEFPRGRVSDWATRIPYPVNFGDVVQLVGVELPRRQIAPQLDGVNIQLYWQPLVERVDLPLNVFVHMSRRDGRVHAQRDLLGMPTLQWSREIVFVQDNFVVAGDTPPGNYIISLGVYHYLTGERLPILGADGGALGERLIVERVRVAP